MILNDKRILVFTSILFISCLFYTRLVLDLTHTPRFFILSALLVFYILFFIPVKVFAQPINVVSVAGILFCLLSFSSAFWAVNPHEVWFVSAKAVCSVTVFLIAAHLFRTSCNTVNSIAKVVIFISIITVTLALLQWREIDLFGIGFPNESPLYYITSTNSHKNLVSSFLYMILPFMLIGRFHYQSSFSYLRIVTVTGILIVLGVLQTRAVWLALGSTVALFCIIIYILTADRYLRWKKMCAVGTIVFIFIVAGIIFLPRLGGAVFGNTDSLQERVLIWRNTVQIIQDNPLLGVGAGNWQIHFPQYSLSGIWRCDELNVTFQRPHNDFLWICSELGVVGLLLQLFIWVAALYNGWKYLRLLTSRNDQMWLALFISFYIGGAVILMVDFPIERAEHSIFMAIGAAYLFTRSDNSWSWNLPYPKLLKIGAVLILCFSTYVAFKRISGEFFTKQLYEAKIHRDGRSMLRNANKAISFTYSLDPVSVPIAWYCGTAFIYEHNVASALGCFKLAYKCHPYQRNVLNDLGSGYMACNNVVLAEKYYKEAIRISPRFDEPALNIVALYIQKGDIDMAQKYDSLLTHNSVRRNELKLLLNN